ncbi:MAG: hypothetical protein ABUS79_06380 [Pseudomonadota bacterium]
MTNGGDLPPWLRPAGPRRRADDRDRFARVGALALVLLAAGGGAGYLVGLRRAPRPMAAPAPACPPPVACASPAAAPPHPGASHPAALAGPRHAKPVHAPAAALVPLPDRKPMDDTQRTLALRAFASRRAPELRDCLDDPDQGPPVQLGAAFEIKANGAVDLVQILGADSAPREVRRCYASRLKKWRFPEDLLRGEEKLLVNFVL